MSAVEPEQVRDWGSLGAETRKKIRKWAILKYRLQASDADDVEQETALKLFEYCRNRPQGFPFSEKLAFGIARHCILDVFRSRKQKRTAMTSFCGFAEIEQPEAHCLLAIPADEEWEWALKRLKLCDRKIVSYYLIERGDITVIAERLCMTVKAVNSRLERKRRKFRN